MGFFPILKVTVFFTAMSSVLLMILKNMMERNTL